MHTEGYSSRFVCLSVCYSSNSYIVQPRSKSKVPAGFISYFKGFWLVDFAKSVSFKIYGEKNYFYAVLALSVQQRLRVQSGLLDGTAFEALLLVVCTYLGSDLQKKCRHCTPPFNFLRIADPTSTCCRPVLLAHAAPYNRPHPLSWMMLWWKAMPSIKGSTIRMQYFFNCFVCPYAACIQCARAEAYAPWCFLLIWLNLQGS